MNTEDDDVNDIMVKLQNLQEVRYKRMCQWNRSSVTEDSQKGQGDVETKSKPNELLQKLQQELMSLMSQDDAIFRQLLLLHRSINQLKQQQQINYCSDDDSDEEDIEVCYLSSASSMGAVEDRFGHRKDSATNFHLQPYFNTDHYVSCDHTINNSEDSAVSLQSSNLSSLPASLAPSPTNVTMSPASNEDIQPTDFHRHIVTYPPSRANRHSRHNIADGFINSRACSVSIPNGVDGLGRTLNQNVCEDKILDQSTSSSTSFTRKTVSPMVQMLVRSRSITFLPRGALIRREESCDSGFHGSNQTSAREIFV
ncbi:hypothetical protein CHUAL_004755 [Chamberlinius hualienensis]